MAKIMYIEDNGNLRNTGKMLLEQKGNSVIALETAKGAIAIASIYKPDLIITDHDLGTDYTGLMFAKRAKENGFNVAMMTGSDVREDTRCLGIPFFSKPYLITDVADELMKPISEVKNGEREKCASNN